MYIVNKSSELRNIIYHSVRLSDSTHSHKRYLGSFYYSPYICYEKGLSSGNLVATFSTLMMTNISIHIRKKEEHVLV